MIYCVVVVGIAALLCFAGYADPPEGAGYRGWQLALWCGTWSTLAAFWCWAFWGFGRWGK